VGAPAAAVVLARAATPPVGFFSVFVRRFPDGSETGKANINLSRRGTYVLFWASVVTIQNPVEF